jgi:hypothetical protein
MTELPPGVSGAYQSLRESTLANLEAPGVPAVRRTVRRRRAVRAALAVAVLAILVPWGIRSLDGGHTDPTPAASASAEPSATTSPSASASASAEAPVAPAGQPSSPPSKTASPAKPACRPLAKYEGGQFGFYTSCPGAQLKVFFVTYRTTDGQKVLYRTGSFTLTEAKPTASATAPPPPEVCSYFSFYVQGASAPPPSLPAHVGPGSADGYWAGLGGLLLGAYYSDSCS